MSLIVPLENSGADITLDLGDASLTDPLAELQQLAGELELDTHNVSRL